MWAWLFPLLVEFPAFEGGVEGCAGAPLPQLHSLLSVFCVLRSQQSLFSTGLGESSQEECENRSGFCCWVGMESLLSSPFVILRRKAKEIEKVCSPEAAGGGWGRTSFLDREERVFLCSR